MARVHDATTSNVCLRLRLGNATTDDLWDALSMASGQDVKDFMVGWLGPSPPLTADLVRTHGSGGLASL